MMRCLRDMNMSKFVAEDVPLFLSLIDDLFPALKADRASFPEISAALEKVSKPVVPSCHVDQPVLHCSLVRASCHLFCMSAAPFSRVHCAAV